MRKKLIRFCVVALCLLLVVEAVLLIAVVVTAKRMDNPQHADTMIVLGAGINMEGLPKSTLQYRLARTYELYEAGYAPAIIVTGAQGDDEPMPEAYAMKEYLVALGVPADAVYCDPDSYNSRENLENAKAIMDAQGFETALLITSDYHVWRALRLCEDIGIVASGAGARNARTIFYAARNCVRETGSWIKYFVESRLL